MQMKQRRKKNMWWKNSITWSNARSQVKSLLVNRPWGYYHSAAAFWHCPVLVRFLGVAFFMNTIHGCQGQGHLGVTDEMHIWAGVQLQPGVSDKRQIIGRWVTDLDKTWWCGFVVIEKLHLSRADAFAGNSARGMKVPGVGVAGQAFLVKVSRRAIGNASSTVFQSHEFYSFMLPSPMWRMTYMDRSINAYKQRVNI